MHLKRFRKTYSSSCQPFHPSTQRQMLALNFLRITLTNPDLINSKELFIRIITIRINLQNTKRLQQQKQLLQNIMLTRTKRVRQNLPTLMIYCMPKPTLMTFIVDKRPHLIHLHLFNTNQFNNNL